MAPDEPIQSQDSRVQPRWRGSRFRLRTLFTVIAFLAVLLAWWRDHDALERQLERGQMVKDAIAGAEFQTEFLLFQLVNPGSRMAVWDDNKSWSSLVWDVDVNGDILFSELPHPGFGAWRHSGKSHRAYWGNWVTKDHAVRRLRDIFTDRGRNPYDRAAAAVGLSDVLGKAAIPDLVAALEDDSFAVRYCAAHVLGGFGADAKNAVQLLLREACNPASPEPAYMAHQAHRIDPSVRIAPRLIELLDHADTQTRGRAAEILSELDSEERTAAVPRLIELLRDPEPKIRIAAAWAAARIAPPGTIVGALHEAFRQEDERIVRQRLAVMILWADDASHGRK